MQAPQLRVLTILNPLHLPWQANAREHKTRLALANNLLGSQGGSQLVQQCSSLRAERRHLSNLHVVCARIYISVPVFVFEKIRFYTGLYMKPRMEKICPFYFFCSKTHRLHSLRLVLVQTGWHWVPCGHSLITPTHHEKILFSLCNVLLKNRNTGVC